MVYFTVYLKNLNNSTGYVDTALADDQLMRDYLQYLDIGVKAHRAYAVVDAVANDVPVGVFAVNLADVAAISATVPRESNTAESDAAPDSFLPGLADLGKPTAAEVGADEPAK